MSGSATSPTQSTPSNVAPVLQGAGPVGSTATVTAPPSALPVLSGSVAGTFVITQRVNGISSSSFGLLGLTLVYQRALAAVLNISPADLTSQATITEAARLRVRTQRQLQQSTATTVTTTINVRGNSQTVEQVRAQVVTTQTASAVQVALRATPSVCPSSSTGACVVVENASIVTPGAPAPGDGSGGGSGNSGQPSNTASGNGSASGGNGNNGLSTAAIVGIVVAIIVVVIAVGYIVYSTGSGSKKQSAEDRLMSSLNVYSRKASNGETTSPAFMPHISKGQTPQRYSGSGSGRNSGARRSFGNSNTVEMSIYNSSYSDKDSSVSSQNPHFASPHLQHSGRASGKFDPRRSSGTRLSFSR